jgi:hypothetical protein
MVLRQQQWSWQHTIGECLRMRVRCGSTGAAGQRLGGPCLAPFGGPEGSALGAELPCNDIFCMLALVCFVMVS